MQNIRIRNKRDFSKAIAIIREEFEKLEENFEDIEKQFEEIDNLDKKIKKIVKTEVNKALKRKKVDVDVDEIVDKVAEQLNEE